MIAKFTVTGSKRMDSHHLHLNLTAVFGAESIEDMRILKRIAIGDKGDAMDVRIFEPTEKVFRWRTR